MTTGGRPSLGPAGLVGGQLTGVVGDIGLSQVSAGHPRWLGLAEVLDELGLGYGGQHGAGALPHAGVREQLCCGAPIGVPHLIAQLRIEPRVAAEGRGGGGGPPCAERGAGPQPGPEPPDRANRATAAPGAPAFGGSCGTDGRHRPSTETRPGPQVRCAVLPAIRLPPTLCLALLRPGA